MPRQFILSPRAATALLLPGLFVFLWSTGFIGSKIVVQHAPPLTFLAMRLGIASLALVPLLVLLPCKWPDRLSIYLHSAVVGILVHGLYLGGVFVAISLGTGAGLSALIVGLQPLLTLCLSVIFIGEKAGPLKVAGVLVGLAGFIIVISDQITFSQVSISGLILCSVSLLGISAGTVYQKRITTDIDLLPGVFIQYIGATLALLPFAILLETNEINWNAEFILASAWLVLGLSVGAVLLLMRFIQSSEVGNVSSLFYLVPPLTALEAFLLFDESLSSIAIAGMLLSVGGVAMVLHSPKPDA